MSKNVRHNIAKLNINFIGNSAKRESPEVNKMAPKTYDTTYDRLKNKYKYSNYCRHLNNQPNTGGSYNSSEDYSEKQFPIDHKYEEFGSSSNTKHTEIPVSFTVYYILLFSFIKR